MLWSAVGFETCLLWLCCPWISYLLALVFFEEFRACKIGIYLVSLIVCIPTYILYVYFILPLQRSLYMEVPILLSFLVFVSISKWSTRWNSKSVGQPKSNFFAAVALILYLICGITTLFSLAWMGM